MTLREMLEETIREARSPLHKYEDGPEEGALYKILDYLPEEIDEDDFDRVVKALVDAVFNTCKEAGYIGE